MQRRRGGDPAGGRGAGGGPGGAGPGSPIPGKADRPATTPAPMNFAHEYQIAISY